MNSRARLVVYLTFHCVVNTVGGTGSGHEYDCEDKIWVMESEGDEEPDVGRRSFGNLAAL